MKLNHDIDAQSKQISKIKKEIPIIELEVAIEINFENDWLIIGSMLAPINAEITIAIVGFIMNLLRFIGRAVT